MTLKSILITTLLLVATPALLAHDFWIEPSTFRPAVGANVSVSLRVGQELIGDPVPRDSASIERFVLRDAGADRDIGGFEGQDPAGWFRVQSAGIQVIGYRSKPRPVELPAGKFEQYLRDEGLERIVALRAKSGDSAKPSKEIFSRCAKSLLLAGDGKGGAVFSKPLGLRYELIPESNPMTAAELKVRALYEGKPLANALLVALDRDDPSVRIDVRTDAGGRAAFHLPKNGVWLIKSVQMIAAPAGSGADWESLWASLTFER
jgi:uncharacterized GH25 family protein